MGVNPTYPDKASNISLTYEHQDLFFPPDAGSFFFFLFFSFLCLSHQFWRWAVQFYTEKYLDFYKYSRAVITTFLGISLSRKILKTKPKPPPPDPESRENWQKSCQLFNFAKLEQWIKQTKQTKELEHLLKWTATYYQCQLSNIHLIAIQWEYIRLHLSVLYEKITMLFFSIILPWTGDNSGLPWW